MKWCKTVVSVVVLLPTVVLATSIPCNSTTQCTRLLREGSVCTEGYCSNPFAGGCLRRILGNELFPKRVCNSDDTMVDRISGVCAEPPPRLNYTEIRIAPGNWESPMFISWIIQILLSELVGVPVTFETGSNDLSFSMYHEDPNAFDYANVGYNWEAIQQANRVFGNCQSVLGKQQCAHVLPEVWNGQLTQWSDAQAKGEIEAVEGNGEVGKLSWYIPNFLAEQEPSIVSFYGLRGEERRQLLADMFKRPTTWLDYCQEESVTNCSRNDQFATRWPRDEQEQGKYFEQGSYKGYFRATDANNCTRNSKTCTGHIVDSTCQWSTLTESQLYWHNIHLKSDGPLKPNGGYNYASMVEIWEAANATLSPVMMLWFEPDWVTQKFRGGPGAFQKVILWEPTYDCTRNRVPDEARCSSDVTARRGDRGGACDYDAHLLQRVMAISLKRQSEGVPEASRSPAYETLRGLQVSNLAIEDMFNTWVRTMGDNRGYRAREVVCDWVAHNIDVLQGYVPKGYPRTVKETEEQYTGGSIYAAQAVAAFVTLMVLTTTAVGFHFRKEKVIAYAQPAFLRLILSGFLLVSLGAVIYPVEPSKASCVAKQWLILLGYTLELVPLLVKVAAINKVIREAERMRRVEVSPSNLFGTVALVMVLVIVYLAVWTAVDPPTRVEELVLTNDEEGTVEVSLDCSSSSDAWLLVTLGWQTLLLLATTVLAFQSRNIRQEFNESRSLAIMVYSHFIFLVIRLTIFFLSDSFSASTMAVITSFILSLDTFFALLFYFGPKFMTLASSSRVVKEHRRKSMHFAIVEESSVEAYRRGSVCGGVRGSVVEMKQPELNGEGLSASEEFQDDTLAPPVENAVDSHFTEESSVEPYRRGSAGGGMKGSLVEMQQDELKGEGPSAAEEVQRGIVAPIENAVDSRFTEKSLVEACRRGSVGGSVNGSGVEMQQEELNWEGPSAAEEVQRGTLAPPIENEVDQHFTEESSVEAYRRGSVNGGVVKMQQEELDGEGPSAAEEVQADALAPPIENAVV